MSSGPVLAETSGDSSENLRLKGDSSRCDLSVTQLSCSLLFHQPCWLAGNLTVSSKGNNNLQQTPIRWKRTVSCDLGLSFCRLQAGIFFWALSVFCP